MALSNDQKALLRLLAQREQGYEDIAALMGISVEEVRARVKDALDAVEREKEEAPAPAPSPPTSPPPAPKAPQPPKPDPEPPAVPTPASRPTTPPLSSPSPTGKSKKLTLPKERRIYAIAAGLAAIVVVIVLLATGVLGGSDSHSDSTATAKSETSSPSSADTVAELTGSDKLTGAVLKPTDGGDAEGAALLGRGNKKQVLLQVEATGLEPSPKDSSYTIWLYKSPKLALRIGSVRAPEGGIRIQLPAPEELLRAIAGQVFDQVSISLTSDADYAAAVKKAKAANSIPPYTGTEVLRGKLEGPLTEVATKADSKTGN